MRMSVKFGQRLPLWVVVIVPLLVFALACGPGEEATPTPTTAAPTPTSEGPVASPTPTTEAPPMATATVGPQRGGTFRLSHSVSPPNWDPHTTGWYFQGYYTQPLSNNIIYNPGGLTLICEICINDQFTLENAGKTWVLPLRQGIKFSDGKEMTSADVAWSLRKMMGEVDGVVAPRCGVLKEYVESVEAPSQYQVRINLIRPSPIFLPKLLQFPHCSVVQDGKTRSDLQTQLIGTGPWLLKEYLPKATATYVRNPNYWKPGLPYFDEVVIYWAADSTAELVALLANRIEYYVPYGGMPTFSYKADLERLQGAGKLTLRTELSACNPGIFLNHSRPPFDDKKVRQAANLAIDRRAHGATVDWGYVTFVFYPSASHGSWGRPESEIWDVLPGWGTGAKKEQELQQAKQLLIDAGYSQGVEATYVVRGTANELYMDMLNKVNIRTKVKLYGQQSELDQIITNLDYNYHTISRCQITRDPDEWLLSYWLTGGSRNWMGYSNPEVDRLANQQSAEPDPVKRKALIRQASDILLEDVNMLVVPGNNSGELWWNYLNWPTRGQGYSAPFAGTAMYRWEDWWFDESLR